MKGENVKMEELKKIISEIVEDEQGIKEIALIVKVCSKLHEQGMKIPESDELIQIIEDLVVSKDLVALNYELAKFPGKMKTIYFAKNTNFV